MQEAFRLDDLRHARLAAHRAGNPFFAHALVDHAYTRVVFCGRGLLLTASRRTPRHRWRVHLAFFTPVHDGAWFAILPHHAEHADAAAARRQAEELAAQMHTTTWQHALGLFATRPGRWPDYDNTLDTQA